MRFKELSMQVEEEIIRLKNKNKSMRYITKTLGLAKSTVWYILKEKECTGKINNTKRPERQQKTTKADDCRIMLDVTTSSQR